MLLTRTEAEAEAKAAAALAVVSVKETDRDADGVFTILSIIRLCIATTKWSKRGLLMKTEERTRRRRAREDASHTGAAAGCGLRAVTRR